MSAAPPPSQDDPKQPGEDRAEPKRRRAALRQELLDPHAVFVVKRLKQNDHEAYLVGGCVRDLLCGLEPKDFDVATDAHPNRIKRLFRSARVIGRRFRLVHVRFPGEHIIETATFRGDPSRHQGDDSEEEGSGRSRDWRNSAENVFGTAIEDARRRDFTINGLFYDPGSDEVIDWVDGLRDLERRIVRCIGDPWERLREDPVRMLRAVHFAHRMDFALEEDLAQAIHDLSHLITDASQARLYVELIKMLGRGRACGTFRDLHDRGVLRTWLPELSAALDTPASWPEEDGGTHEDAQQGEPERLPVPHATWNLLGAADRYGLAAHGVPESLSLAVLFGPWIRAGYEEHRKPTWSGFQHHFETIFRPIALRMSVPRWATQQMCEALWLLDELRHPPPAERRRRTVKKSGFPIALKLLELDLMARDSATTLLDLWEEAAAEAGVTTDLQESVSRARAEASGRRSPRRRGGAERSPGGQRRSGGGRRSAGGAARTPRPSGPPSPEADAWEPPPR